MSWFAFNFNTTMKDPRLMELTLEELVIHYYMFKYKNNPEEIIEEKEGDDFEKWLQKELGDKYETNDQMIKTIEQEEQEYTDKVRSKFGELPKKITTDFTKIEE